MTRIVLEVPYERDVALLLALLDRLNIRVVNQTSETKEPGPANDDHSYILKGLPAREDFEDYVREFEASRRW